MDKELKYIKKLYGEKFMQFCRSNFPTILENDGVLLDLLKKLVHPSKSLFQDLVECDMLDDFVVFVNNQYEKICLQPEEKQNDGTIYPKPEEMFDMEGYVLYGCQSVEDVERFKKYYAPGEVICTYWDVEDRLSSHHIFFAVKKDVDKIKRTDFVRPQRQDQYGTSVISLQFDRETGYLSIKNRYNHTVMDPDATFSNNLDNIHLGLTESFIQHYGVGKPVEAGSSFEIPGYVRDKDGKFYKYNYEIDNIYYCEDNIVVRGGVASQYPKDRYELIDHFLYDKTGETIVDLCATTERTKKMEDGFVQTFDNIEKVDIVKGKNGRRIFVITDKEGKTSELGVDGANRITSYSNHHIKSLPIRFFGRGKYLKSLDLPSLEEMANGCFRLNNGLTQINLDKLKIMGDECFWNNKQLTSVSLDSLQMMGGGSFQNASSIKTISCPCLKSMGDYCFQEAMDTAKINMPNLELMGSCCFETNTALTQLSLPKLKEMGFRCFYLNKTISSLSMDSLKKIGSNSFSHNTALTKLSLPNLEIMSADCFLKNETIEKLSMDNLWYMGNNCFMGNKALNELSLPSLTEMMRGCFYSNTTISKLSLDSLETMEADCFKFNKELTQLALQNTIKIGENCFAKNETIASLSLPMLTELGSQAFRDNKQLTSLSLENLTIMRGFNFEKNTKLIKVVAPNLKNVWSNCFYNAVNATEVVMDSVIDLGVNVFGKNPNIRKLLEMIVNNEKVIE